MAGAYYNEFDPKKAAWLRELMKAGLIADGEVDERSIRDVQPEDLDGFTQCHFFAGIGVWSHCLRRAGWSDDRPIWTGSPPCQPFSVAGKKQAQADDRHLWPDLFRLISERRPQSVICEQVASKDGLGWLDLVLLNLESAGYAVWPVAIPACGFGAPHKRERLAIVAHAREIERKWGERGNAAFPRRGGHTDGAEQHGGVGQPDSNGCQPGRIATAPSRHGHSAEPASIDGEPLGLAIGEGLQRHAGHGHNSAGRRIETGPTAPAGFANGFWSGAELIWCRDNKWRPVKPGIFPLAHGSAKGMGRVRDPGLPINANDTQEARTLRLKGYGDAIVTEVFVAVIEAGIELMGEASNG